MQTRINLKSVLLLAMLTVSSAATRLHAQSPDAGYKQPRLDLAVDYEYVHANAPPGGCGCFNLNGGSASLAWHLKPGRFAVVADAGSTHAGAISSNNYSLTLSTYTVGVRYQPRFHYSPLKPFGEVLVGFAHSSGSLVQGQNGAASTGGNAFASLVGGGVDLRATRHFSLRLIEADYLVTTFSNGGNDHQNNLRLGAGLVLRF